VVAAYLFAKSHDLHYSRADAERDLLAARTSAEEHAASDRIQRLTRVALSLEDANGKVLGPYTSDWRNLAQTITFHQFDGVPLSHRIINVNNIPCMMHE
jgi:hypothetical protein